MAKGNVKCKVKILCPLNGVYLKYQPTVGAVYDADYFQPRNTDGRHNYAPICVIKVLDKFICLKPGEYEILEEE